MSERHDRGMATRRRVLGAAHVDRAEAAKTPFDAPFQDLITEGAWGQRLVARDDQPARAVDADHRAPGRDRQP